MAARLLVLAVLLSLASGCGYHVIGTKPRLPASIRSIAVGDIDNRTNQHGLEKTLAFAIEREVHLRRHYQMSEDVSTADAVLRGRIRDIRRRSVAFDAKDQAVEYELALILDLWLVRRSDQKVLWRVNGMEEVDEYASSPVFVVVSSAEFQRDNLAASDLRRSESDRKDDARKISTIQLADAQRRRTLARLLQRAVRTAYDQMIEGF